MLKSVAQKFNKSDFQGLTFISIDFMLWEYYLT